ncbi:MAG: hypothetical protein H0U10_07310, partial [Chloroflexia bacterium]|nr:hypothetical protein [Chloroflexia bacterium]
IGRLRFHGIVAWLAWLTIHLAYLNGFRNRLRAVIDWFLMYVTMRRSVRLISGLRRPDGSTAVPAATDLRSEVASRVAAEPAPPSASLEPGPEPELEPEPESEPASASRTWA